MSSENSKIAKNTAMLYFRMLFMLFVSLYTSRMILSVLGVSDFGVYNVVGGVVTMFSFLNAAMANGTQRFLSFELGKNDMIQFKRVFSTTLLIHILIACLIFVLAETIGLWFLNSKLNIPPERMLAANWVYQFSILTFIVTVIQVPYNASIIAHEKMNVYAYVSIIEVSLKLIIVLLLININYDKLILYGFLFFIISFIVAFIYRTYCKTKFKECAFEFFIDKQLFNKLLGFAGWNLYGNVTCVVADQGVNMILNVFFGPMINAARGVAIQINGVVRSFASNFQMAANPQIIKSYAAENKDNMMRLIFMSSKFSYYMLFFIALPILIETDFILRIWLKIVPDYTALFFRLIIINGLIDVFSGPLQTAANATGKIKLYQFSEGTIILLSLPVSYLFYRFGYPPESTFYVGIITAFLLQFIRLYLLKAMINLDMKSFVMNVFFKSIFLSIIAAVIPFSLTFFIDNEIIRFFSVCISSVFSSVSIIYLFGLDKVEQKYIIGKLTQAYVKLFKVKS